MEGFSCDLQIRDLKAKRGKWRHITLLDLTEPREALHSTSQTPRGKRDRNVGVTSESSADS